MTAPHPDEARVDAPVPGRYYHKYCATEALRASRGLVRETLCGKVMTGRQRGGAAGLPPCAMCADLLPAHRAACSECQAVGWLS